MQPLFERVRPKRWEDVIGQDEAVNQLQRLSQQGSLAGRAYWLSGPSGTGKTTIARLIAAEVADPFCTVELDAGELTVPLLSDLDRESRTYGWGEKNGRAYIVNEAHGLRRDIVRRLLKVLEPVPPHVVWCFTTTKIGEQGLFDDQIDAGPLVSRCTPVAMSCQSLARPFAEFLQRTARDLGLDGKPIARYIKLIQSKSNNLRAGLQAVEAGETLGAGRVNPLGFNGIACGRDEK